MEIERREMTIQSIVRYDRHTRQCQGFVDEGYDGGVYGMENRSLNIRPIYQREFFYDDKRQKAVIETIRNGWPLNVLYWVPNLEEYEVLDGQQRLISIGRFVSNVFSVKWSGDVKYFDNLSTDQQDIILNYPLTVFICTGSHQEKMDWFQIINIPGAELTKQELRNAIYSGPYVSDARRYFSRRNEGADQYSNYLKGTLTRQDYLERVLKWISNNNIDEYMATHQRDEDAETLWDYFVNVMDWIEEVFPTYRREMKGIEWGALYNTYGENNYDSATVEAEVSRLMEDEEVTKKSGIYEYIFTREERNLSLRTFGDNDKRSAYERQEGICPDCEEHFEIEEMEGDHITPWSRGGGTIPENCQMLCKACNRIKGAR